MTNARRPTLFAFVATAGFGLLSRVAIPAGFMPAPLAEGWPVTICPVASGLPAAMTTSSQDRHRGHHEAGESPSRDDSPRRHGGDSTCALGLSLAAPSMLAEICVTHLTLDLGHLEPPAIPVVAQGVSGLVNSRAPPR